MNDSRVPHKRKICDIFLLSNINFCFLHALSFDCHNVLFKWTIWIIFDFGSYWYYIKFISTVAWTANPTSTVDIEINTGILSGICSTVVEQYALWCPVTPIRKPAVIVYGYPQFYCVAKKVMVRFSGSDGCLRFKYTWHFALTCFCL